MKKTPEVRLEVSDRETLDKLASESPPFGLRGAPPERSFHRDVYFDSSDRSLAARGVSCRIRTRSDDRRVLSVEIRETNARQVYDQLVLEIEPQEILGGRSHPARRLRAVIDPSALRPTLSLETERLCRRVWSGWLPLPQFEFVYDVVTVRSDHATHTFCELKVRHLRRGKPSLEQVVQDFRARYGLRMSLTTKMDRARKILVAILNCSLLHLCYAFPSLRSCPGVSAHWSQAFPAVG